MKVPNIGWVERLVQDQEAMREEMESMRDGGSLEHRLDEIADMLRDAELKRAQSEMDVFKVLSTFAVRLDAVDRKLDRMDMRMSAGARYVARKVNP